MPPSQCEPFLPRNGAAHATSCWWPSGEVFHVATLPKAISPANGKILPAQSDPGRGPEARTAGHRLSAASSTTGMILNCASFRQCPLLIIVNGKHDFTNRQRRDYGHDVARRTRAEEQTINIKKSMNTTANRTNLLQPLTINTAPEGSQPVLQNIQKGFGFIPNLMATFANSPAVLKGYLALDAEWEKSGFTPSERQIVLLTASVENDCNYCTAAHSTIAKAFLKVPAETVSAIRANAPTGDERIDALAGLTREIVSHRGHARDEAVNRFLAAGFSKPQVMELLLGVALKTISNYLDHLNPAPIDAAFASEK